MLDTMSPKKPAGGGPPDRHQNTVVSFRPPPELLERLRVIAKEEKRSVAKLVEILIEEALESRDGGESVKLE